MLWFCLVLVEGNKAQNVKSHSKEALFDNTNRFSPFNESIVGSVVECSPATRAARVRFPDDAGNLFFFNSPFAFAVHCCVTFMLWPKSFFYSLLIFKMVLVVQNVHHIPQLSAFLPATAIPRWKYQFSSDHWSQATLGQVSTWMGDRLGTPGAVVFFQELYNTFSLLSPQMLLLGMTFPF